VIRHDAHEMMYCCSMKPELVGFAYRHMFPVLKYANMKDISSGCILQQWNIWAKEQIALNEDNIGHEEDNGLFDGKRKIRNQQVVITKGAPQGKMVQTCEKCRDIGHTRRTCPKNANAKYSGKKTLDDLDGNEVSATGLQYSPSNSACDIGYNNTKLVPEKQMSVMPNFYIDG